MEKKQINELIKKVRIDSGMKQKEACKNVMDEPSYSRVERGVRKIDFEQIVGVLGNLSVSMEEFITVYVRPEIEENVRFYFRRLFKSRPSESADNEIIALYKNLANRYPDLKFDELGVYFDIKAYFHQEYPDKVGAITLEELDFIVTKFKRTRRKRFFSEDYRLISHTIMNMEKEHIEEIFETIFPIENDIFLTEQSRRFLSLMFLNSITPMLKAKEYETVKKLLDLAEEHTFLYEDSYYYRLNLTYLKNMFLFLTTRELKCLEEVTTFVKMLDSLGEENNARLIRQEIKGLLEDEGPDGLSEHAIIIAKI